MSRVQPDVSRAAFRERAAVDEPTVVRLAVTLDVDVEPLTAYDALADGDYAFLLESAPKVASHDPDGAFRPADTAEERHTRFSFVGYDPSAVIAVTQGEMDVTVLRETPATDRIRAGAGDTLDTLRGGLPDLPTRGFPGDGRQRLSGGLVGFLAYDAVYDLWLEEVGLERPDSPVPDAEFVLTTRTLCFDHRDDELSLVFTPVIEPEAEPGARYDECRAIADRVRERLATAEAPDPGGFDPSSADAGAREDYEAAVEAAKRHVTDGDIYQGVISRTREVTGRVDPQGLYAALREINPSPYMYLLDHDDRAVVGASPETQVSVHDGQVACNPIAGTCPRGTSPVEDRRLAGEMLADGKERAEHTMLVDLARNDVRRVAEPGSVRVPEFMSVLKYSHVQHIESTVTGDLRADCDAFDAMRATFPAGTLSGAPKVRAMEIIDALEASPRGVYGGGVGYVDWSGDADTAIVIRTATVDEPAGDAPDRVRVRAGAGIVADSDPTAEYEETEAKMDGTLSALDRITREAAEPAVSDGPVGSTDDASGGEPPR